MSLDLSAIPISNRRLQKHYNIFSLPPPQKEVFLMEYTFSYREKNGGVCLILSYKVGTKWRQKTKQGFKNQREARRYQDELLAQVKELEGLTDDATLINITLQQFLPIFMRDKKEFLAPNTLKNYALALKKWEILPLCQLGILPRQILPTL